MTLGDIIKQYRNENSATMEQVAKQCGITKGYVAMLERNINSKTGRPVKPTIETILKVCDGLRLDIDSVFQALDDDYVITLHTKVPSHFKNSRQEHFISQFNLLNSEGQDKAISYVDDLVASGKYDPIRELDADIPRNAVAAHNRTDIDTTDEMHKFDDDIMEDDDF